MKLVEVDLILARGIPYFILYYEPEIPANSWIGSHLKDGKNFIYLKVDQHKILDCLYDRTKLQEVTNSCEDNFYYKDREDPNLVTYFVGIK